MLYHLPNLPWFAYHCESFNCFRVAAITGTEHVVETPDGWRKAHRKQLPADILTQRTAISWDIPKAELEKAMAVATPFRSSDLYSPVIYLAGAGVCLHVRLGRISITSPYQLDIYVQLAKNQTAGLTVGSPASILSCKLKCHRLVPGQSEPEVVREARATLSSEPLREFGRSEALTFTGSSDLAAHLVDGHLKLRLRVEEII
jgi:hypothetical protein